MPDLLHGISLMPWLLRLIAAVVWLGRPVRRAYLRVLAWMGY